VGASVLVCSRALTVVALVVLGAGFAVLGTPPSGPGAPPPPGALLIFVGVCWLILTLSILGSAIGWWWLTTKPDPEPYDPAPSASRVLVRVCVVIQFLIVVALIAFFAFFFISPGSPATTPENTEGFFAQAFGMALGLIALWFAALVVLITKLIATMCYVRWIARRLPSHRLHQTAGHAMWALPTLYVVGWCVYVGPPLAYLLQWILLAFVWRGLARALRNHPGPNALPGSPLQPLAMSDPE